MATNPGAKRPRSNALFDVWNQSFQFLRYLSDRRSRLFLAAYRTVAPEWCKSL